MDHGRTADLWPRGKSMNILREIGSRLETIKTRSEVIIRAQERILERGPIVFRRICGVRFDPIMYMLSGVFCYTSTYDMR
jgi:hypothetical protein